jgi:hypothetical protein
VIGRTETGKTIHAAQWRFDAAKVFGTYLSAESILASGRNDRTKGRTYDRKRSDTQSNRTLASGGPSTYAQRFCDNDMHKNNNLKRVP